MRLYLYIAGVWGQFGKLIEAIKSLQNNIQQLLSQLANTLGRRRRQVGRTPIEELELLDEQLLELLIKLEAAVGDDDLLHEVESDMGKVKDLLADIQEALNEVEQDYDDKVTNPDSAIKDSFSQLKDEIKLVEESTDETGHMIADYKVDLEKGKVNPVFVIFSLYSVDQKKGKC